MNQPQNKHFKHAIIATLVISLGGVSFATFADTGAPTAAPTTVIAPAAESQAARKAHWEEFRAKHGQERTQRRTDMFQQADTNHDGQLSLEEWLAFKPHHHHSFWQRLAFWHHWGHDRHQHHDGGRHEGFENRFKTLDADHDGSIRMSEAQAGAPEIAKHFNEIDTDHNGQISQDERHAYFKAQHEKSQS